MIQQQTCAHPVTIPRLHLIAHPRSAGLSGGNPEVNKCEAFPEASPGSPDESSLIGVLSHRSKHVSQIGFHGNKHRWIPNIVAAPVPHT